MIIFHNKMTCLNNIYLFFNVLVFQILHQYHSNTNFMAYLNRLLYFISLYCKALYQTYNGVTCCLFYIIFTWYVTTLSQKLEKINTPQNAFITYLASVQEIKKNKRMIKRFYFMRRWKLMNNFCTGKRLLFKTNHLKTNLCCCGP